MLRLIGKTESDCDDAMARCAGEYLRDCPHLEAVCYFDWCLSEAGLASPQLLGVFCWSARSRFGYQGGADRAELVEFYSALMELKPRELETLADTSGASG